METTKKPEIRRTASSINKDALVKEASQPKILIGMMRWISNWWIGSGIPVPWVPAFGAATLSSSVLVVRHALADAAAGARHEFPLHALVASHHVEDAGRKPQQEEEQKQPGLGAEPPVQTPANATTDHDRANHLRGHAHAIGHAAAAHFGIEVGLRIGMPLRFDPAEPVVELGYPALECSCLLGAHLVFTRTSTIRCIWHEDYVLGGRRPDSPPGAHQSARTLKQRFPRVSRIWRRPRPSGGRANAPMRQLDRAPGKWRASAATAGHGRD